MLEYSRRFTPLCYCARIHIKKLPNLQHFIFASFSSCFAFKRHAPTQQQTRWRTACCALLCHRHRSCADGLFGVFAPQDAPRPHHKPTKDAHHQAWKQARGFDSAKVIGLSDTIAQRQHPEQVSVQVCLAGRSKADAVSVAQSRLYWREPCQV